MGVIAKYKFNNTLADLLPEFNSEFTSDLYTVTDEVNGEVTTRTIESDELPTLMRFGRVWVGNESATDNRTDSLLEVLDMNTSGLTSCHSMFRYCTNLTSITCEWDTSNVTNMHSMFDICYSLIILDLSNWDTSKVTNMQNMFYGCTSLTTLYVSNFDTRNVTNMTNMFYRCNKLTSLDLSNWNTSNVTNMNGMFFNCTNLTTLDVSNFNTSNVTDMGIMFSYCQSLLSLDLSSFRLDKCTNMFDMFAYCHNIETIILPDEFCASGTVTNMQGVFYQNYKLREINVSNWNTSNVTSMGYMFFDGHNLTSLDVSNWDTSEVTTMMEIFHGCTNLTTLDVSNWDISKVANMDNIFIFCDVLKFLKCNNVTTLNKLNTLLPTKSSTSQGTIICKSDITNLDTTTLQSINWNILDEPTLIAKYVFDKSIHSNCIPYFNTEFEGYFIEDEVVEGSNEVIRTIESCGMLPTQIRFGNSYGQSDFNRRRSLLKMFNICNGLISCFDMFAQCSNLISVCDIDTSNVTNMYCMFYECDNLTSLDVSNFNTSKVTDMTYMFFNCTNLTSLDVSNWDTGNVTTMGRMFGSCKNLASLDLSNWDTSKVANMSSVFYNTPLLTDISVLYMDKSNLQKLVNAMPTNSNKTLWYKDVNIDGITHGDNITLKKYIEENVEIVLNSPLLKGDTIEVKDGKLCHVHRWEKIVLDGSEDEGWQWRNNDDRVNTYNFHCELKKLGAMQYGTKGFSDNLKWGGAWNDYEHIWLNEAKYLTALISIEKITSHNADLFKQWLSENPTTVIYELAEPYYEDITNLQSAPTLKTYLECSVEIDTDLPIDTNVTYRTNLSSVYVIERELDELDNETDLGDILEGEVNE